LDEATLQSYFDGELSDELLESTTVHLASCSTCAAAAREMEEEINLLMTALAPEFEANVPTERLRQRIDSAVLDLRIGAASSPEKAGFGGFLSSLPGFGTQRTLGYAGLVMVLAFAAIFGLVKLWNAPEPQLPVAKTTPAENSNNNNNVAVVVAPPVVAPIINHVPASDSTSPRKNRDVVYRPVKAVAKSTPAPRPEPVKLFPGERSYLQTIARLDSTINSSKQSMRPSLQVEYQRNLAVVDRAIAATRSAAKKNPNDPDTADFMFAAYQSKVDLLNTIADARFGGGRSH
jgi:anti-sigma factor RsiW